MCGFSKNKSVGLNPFNFNNDFLNELADEGLIMLIR